jgi:2-polyprenyl-3-methyl-5-hydroxy-6-metoxy-1,4-benzoquinol methylase
MLLEEFKQRSVQSEWMDDQSGSFEEFENCLHDLEKLNQWSYGYRPTLKWLDKMANTVPLTQPITIFDIGSGAGDMLRSIEQYGISTDTHFNLIGIDINPWAKKAADKLLFSKTMIRFETKDIFSFEADRQADFIISSLFTHHLDQSLLIRFIQWMEEHSKEGWFINDLHRHLVPYYFLKMFTPLLKLDPMVQHDGPVSVQRAFTKEDWESILQEAGVSLEEVEIKWYFPFRYGIERKKR